MKPKNVIDFLPAEQKDYVYGSRKLFRLIIIAVIATTIIATFINNQTTHDNVAVEEVAVSTPAPTKKQIPIISYAGPSKIVLYYMGEDRVEAKINNSTSLQVNWLNARWELDTGSVKYYVERGERRFEIKRVGNKKTIYRFIGKENSFKIEDEIGNLVNRSKIKPDENKFNIYNENNTRIAKGKYKKGNYVFAYLNPTTKYYYSYDSKSFTNLTDRLLVMSILALPIEDEIKILAIAARHLLEI